MSAGYDLYSAETVTVRPRDKAAVKTDLQIEVPEGTYGRVAPRCVNFNLINLCRYADIYSRD